MGKLVLAAKITHVPSMYLSEMDGPHKGCRQAAIDGHKEIARRMRELKVDTIVVFDTHWLVNSGYHINCAPAWEGIYTSNELPHFIKNMPFSYAGNPALGHAIAEVATAAGVHTRAHDATSLSLEYGTLVPMRYMNEDKQFKVVSVSALCTVHNWPIDHPGPCRTQGHRGKVRRQRRGAGLWLPVASLRPERYLRSFPAQGLGSVPGNRRSPGRRALAEGRLEDLLRHAVRVRGQVPRRGMMHDTAMLLGVLGAEEYTGKAEVSRLTSVRRVPARSTSCSPSNRAKANDNPDREAYPHHLRRQNNG